LRAIAHSAAALSALVAAPVGLGMLAVRPSWRSGWLERAGSVGVDSGAVWLHAASVGEALASIPLVDALRKVDHSVVVSTQTLAGRDTLQKSRPELHCQLAPLDHPWLVERALAAAAPRALVLLEAEFWPCWIAAAERHQVPVAVVSGRISDRSLRRYRRVRPLVRRTLRRIAAIGARSELDAERFLELGAEPAAVTVSGDLKLDADLVAAAPPRDLSQQLEGEVVFIAGSTHPGEESAALQALRVAEAAGQGAVLLLAPRRIERAGEIERLVRAQGRRLIRRSSLAQTLRGDRMRPGDVLLLDTLGELRALWSLAAVAFVGGTLAPVGGHNLLEPVLSGRPVLFGPHTRDVLRSVEVLEQCGAGRCVADADELAAALVELLANPSDADARGRRGREELERLHGSSARSLALLERMLADFDGREGI
jgi:3-deoxy-D-manno-octulosonic-acid transferase